MCVRRNQVPQWDDDWWGSPEAEEYWRQTERAGRKNGSGGDDKEAGIAWDDPDVVTVLQACSAHQRATKQVRRDPDKPGAFVSTAYDRIKHWNARPVACRSTVDLYTFLRPASDQLKMDNRRVVVAQDDDGRQKTAGLGSYWLGCRDRRDYDGMRLLPGRPRKIVTPDGR